MYFPKLMPAMISSAFHSLIQLGWGIYTENEQMVCDGLAYLAYSFLEISFPSDSFHQQQQEQQTTNPLEVLMQVKIDPLFQDYLQNGFSNLSFQGRVLKLSGSPDTNHLFLEYFSKCILKEYSPQVLESFCVLLTQLFYNTESRDFFVLHGVTGIFGFKFIVNLLEPSEQTRAINHLWLCILYVYVACDCPNLVRSAPEKEITFGWEELFRRAIDSTDEHEIKMVFVLHKFWEWYPDHDTLWLKVAEEMLSRTSWRYV
eukprot:TRINITY_DN11746_c0_g1_i2.p1 TRINITY_DN11746_c0_g1~~TRINITY_DN11746_c0_g1_i2.p1  ORF type:complete len:258 (+),score=47.52 TRINITY_DN11746_c0_g1_i2:552-1325(+)